MSKQALKKKYKQQTISSKLQCFVSKLHFQWNMVKEAGILFKLHPLLRLMEQTSILREAEK